jgi:hypothetical protein
MFRRLFVAVCAASSALAMSIATAGASQELSLTGSWGGSGELAGHHANVCAEHRIEPGDRRPVLLANSYHNARGTLFCSRVLEIWKATTGPWEGGNWISIPCPHNERPTPGGAGYWTSVSDVTQAGGAFGHHRDGYWHYRFHNHSPGANSMIEMWAVCVDRHSF